jgi:hypothetical protein
VFGSDSDFRPSHEAGDEASVAERASARIIFILPSRTKATTKTRSREEDL